MRNSAQCRVGCSDHVGMNDSNLREIPEDVGYSRPLILSVAVHMLLTALFWAGAMMHTAPETQDAPIESRSLIEGQSAPSLAQQSPPVLPLGANPTPMQTSAGETVSKTAQAVHGRDSARASAAPAKTLSAVTPSRTPIRQSALESDKPARPKRGSTELTAAKAERPPLKSKSPAGTPSKAKTASSVRTASAERNQKTKISSAKSVADKTDAAERKKLESMREAELRRISKSVS